MAKEIKEQLPATPVGLFSKVTSQGDDRTEET